MSRNWKKDSNELHILLLVASNYDVMCVQMDLETQLTEKIRFSQEGTARKDRCTTPSHGID